MPFYVLGIDGGGTKTHGAIVNAYGQLCGYGVGGASNYDDVGVEAARDAIAAAVDAARQTAGLADAQLDAAFLGMAGVVSAQDRSVIHGIARDLRLAPPERVDVDHDCRVALAGGLSGRPGIVLIAGTGSSCYGRDAAGNSWRAGGWGSLIADEGSGYWLGVQAMQAAVRAYDGRAAPTALLEAVSHRLGLAEMNDIMHRLYVTGITRAAVAALAPLVLDAARQSDHTAVALVEQGAQDLADCVLAVARRLRMADEPCELALVGGLFRAGPVFEQPLRAAVASRLPQCRVTEPELPPVLGACLIALRAAGVAASEQVVKTLRRDAQQFRESFHVPHDLAPR